MATAVTARITPEDKADVAVRALDLSKCYRLYDQPRDRLKQALIPRFRHLFGFKADLQHSHQPDAYYDEHWAVRNISLDVPQGETIGIVGRNGSGKSTLLELIAGILTPTSGTVTADGRIAALLELGAGFNPEYSGRENVYLNAALMGLDNSETEERFEDIVSFSELGHYIDHPLRSYSSGMFVRLAFSVAINVNPDILVIDEALAVGDEAFQRKCYSRIQEFQSRGGTILFVSHSSAAVLELCSQAILLDQGEMILSGLPHDVIAEYQKLLYAPSEQAASLRNSLKNRIPPSRPVSDELKRDNSSRQAELDTPQPAPSYDPDMSSRSTVRYHHRGVHIHDASIVTVGGEPVNILVQRQKYVFKYKARFDKPALGTRFGMLLKTTSGYEIGGATTSDIGQGIAIDGSGTVVEVRFQFTCLLTPGTYFLNAGVTGQVDGTETFLDRWIDIVMFKVKPSGYPLATGSVDLLIEPDLNSQAFVTETRG